MKRTLLPALLLTALPLCAAESRELYVQSGTDLSLWEGMLAPLRAAEPELEYRVVEVPPTADSPAAAKARAKAIEAGIAALPSLVLRDDEGVYATLPLTELTPEKLQEARAQANDAEREAEASRRRFEARCYLLCARISREDIDDAAIANAIEECGMLMRHGRATQADVQFLGLRCLYPLLMQQYARGYKGAHTPETEAKLLEAIAALEAARDLAPETELGREAFRERERLRMARREARRYE